MSNHRSLASPGKTPTSVDRHIADSHRRTALVASLAAAAFLAAIPAGWSQTSVGRGAPDPLRADDIVGSEGKGYLIGPGVPDDNMPIYAARDGATPPGVEPLPIEIYTPRENANGEFVGLRHEIVLYDEEAFVEAVRIVHFLDKQFELNEGDPFLYMECVPQIFPVEGVATPIAPNQTFRYTLPDTFGRPWAQIWERHHEEGMQRPEEEDIFSFE